MGPEAALITRESPKDTGFLLQGQFRYCSGVLPAHQHLLYYTIHTVLLSWRSETDALVPEISDTTGSLVLEATL